MSQMYPVPMPPNGERYRADGVLSWKFPPSIGAYTLVGRSRAADATSLYIPELDTLLDCGCLVMSTRPSHVFISHCHFDHCGDVFRTVSRMRPPQIFAPQSSIPDIENVIYHFQALKACGRFDHDRENWLNVCRMVGVQDDQMISFRDQMRVRVFGMDHSVPCYGYGFYDCRKKLKKEYEHLTGKEIAALRKADSTLDVSEERLKPLFLFMGDTSAAVFDRYPTELFEFPLIIVECSFIDNEEHDERAVDTKHLIWTDLEPHVLKHPEITFVLIHFSQQYKSERIKQFFQQLNLPNVVPFI